MNHGRILTNRINELQKIVLRLVYSVFISNFSELLLKDLAIKHVTIRQRNLQTLAYKMFKVKNNLTPETMKNSLSFKRLLYNIRKS